MQLACPLSSWLLDPRANPSHSLESKCFVKTDGMEEMPPIKNAPWQAQPLYRDTRESSRTVMEEGKGSPGDWPKANSL